jgi:hypothetical protein
MLDSARLGRGQCFDDSVFDQSRKKDQRLHLPEAKLLGDRGNIALAVDREQSAPAVRRESDRALIGSLLREPEMHAIVGYRRANGRDPIPGLGGSLQQRDKIAALEIRLRRGLPWRELEVGLRDGKDRAEGILATFAVHDRGDETSAREAKRTDLGVAAYL